MLFWILAAILTAVVVVLLVRPLARPADTVDRAEFDLAVYRDQLAEVDRDVARGLIGPAEAEAARTEISRRALAADRSRQQAGKAGRASRALTAAIIVSVPAITVVAYLATGSPDLPSQPFAQRDQTANEAMAADLAAAEELARRLQSQADDVDGWIELGARYAMLRRWGEASAAYARAIGLIGGVDPGVTGAWAEATVNANQGVVTQDARLGFEQTLEARPGDPRARYYLALATAQAGDGLAALQQWSDLALESPPGASWVPALRDRIERVADELGVDPAPYLAGPSMMDDEALASIEDMTEEQRAAMIDGMVSNLAARLEDEPEDVAGWLRLANAYRVQGRDTEAAMALDQAALHAPDDPQILSQLVDMLLADWRGGPLPAGLVLALERLVVLVPDDPRALLFLGEEAESSGDVERARRYWSDLQALLEPGSVEYEAVGDRLDSLPAP